MIAQVVIEERVSEVQVNDTVVRTVEVEMPGPQGPPGVQGVPGEGDPSFEYIQSSQATVWTINHNLGYRPNVVLRTTGGQVMFAEILHTSVNQAICYFNTAVAGSARCS